MTPLALAAALAAVAGVVASLTARDGRIAAFGVLAMLVAAPFAAPELPGSWGAAARLLGAALAAWIVWAFARGRAGGVSGAGSSTGVAAEVLVAGAAFCAGLQTSVVSPLPGSPAAQAAGFAILVPALVALAGSDVFRAGLGALSLAVAAVLLRAAWLGPAQPLEEVATAVLFAGLAAGACILAHAAGDLAGARERRGQVEASAGHRDAHRVNPQGAGGAHAAGAEHAAGGAHAAGAELVGADPGAHSPAADAPEPAR